MTRRAAPKPVIIAPDPKVHARALADLLGKVYSEGGHSYYQFRDISRGVLERGYAPYDWKAARIGLIGDEIVSHYGVWDFKMRIGRARIRVAGVGSVATSGDHRRQGLMAATAAAAVDGMKARGYDASLLFGIPSFYPRFGYTRAWSETTRVVPVVDLPDIAPKARLRPFRPEPRDDLDTLYNCEYAGLTGSAVRPTYRVCPLPHQRGFLWTGGDRRPAGYVLVEPKGHQLHCAECVGDPETTLRALRRLARRWRCTEIVFPTLHARHPLARRLRQGECTVTTRHRRCAEAMIRTVNLATTLHKMRGELSRRLQRSPMADWTGALLVSDARERVTLRIDGGRVEAVPGAASRHAIRGSDEIARLTIGTEPPEETTEAAATRVTGDARRLMPILFPPQHPMLGAWDRF